MPTIETESRESILRFALHPVKFTVSYYCFSCCSISCSGLLFQAINNVQQDCTLFTYMNFPFKLWEGNALSIGRRPSWQNCMPFIGSNIRSQHNGIFHSIDSVKGFVVRWGLFMRSSSPINFSSCNFYIVPLGAPQTVCFSRCSQRWQYSCLREL